MESATQGCCHTLNEDLFDVLEKNKKKNYVFTEKFKAAGIKCRDNSENKLSREKNVATNVSLATNNSRDIFFPRLSLPLK